MTVAQSKVGVSGPALIEYSSVTGESEPVEKRADDYLYAGGRQMGGAIEVEMVKAVSQSYLTSLWNQEAFCKEKAEQLDQITSDVETTPTGVSVSEHAEEEEHSTVPLPDEASLAPEEHTVQP